MQSTAISIHAPAKGATAHPTPKDYPQWYFNPRSREGSDAYALLGLIGSVLFQSTLPRRERLHQPRTERGISYFNPRSREGSDSPAGAVVSSVKLFQSTLPRRERHISNAPMARVECISIHAPAKGATAKITKTIPNDFCKINNYNNSFA